MTPEVASIVGVIIGGIIGWTSGYFNTISIFRRQEFAKAAAEFRCAFVDAQYRLDENKSYEFVAHGVEVRNILIDHIVSHEKAKIIFSAYLPKDRMPGFNEAWKEYYSQETRNSEYLSEYKSVQHDIISRNDPQEEKLLRELALSRIVKLLSFAEIN